MRIFLLLAMTIVAGTPSAATTIDHNCTDLDAIPSGWVEAARTIDSHYAHTSHGSQLIYGLEFVEQGNPVFDSSVGDCYLPSTPGAYCVFDGQEGVSYITPDLYWETASGLDMTRAVLDDNPTISTSMWSWCTQCDYYSEDQVQAYLDAMTLLESEYPSVHFIYLTGNAQGTGSSGYNRWLRNQQIRSYCLANNKILYDFEDLDSWWFNTSTQQWEQHTYSYEGYQVPSEHPHFYGDEYGHTTAESCGQKGRAWWFMMALIAGWGGTGIVGGPQQPAELFTILQNPASGPARIVVGPGSESSVRFEIFDLAGRLVAIPPIDSFRGRAIEIRFDPDEAGVYLIRCSAEGLVETERLVVLR